MNKEIEYKFLVKNNDWVHKVVDLKFITQSYLVNDGEKNIRIRSVLSGDNSFKYYLTIKSCNSGPERVEVETEINNEQFSSLMDLSKCNGFIQKKRFIVTNNMDTWEIDVFNDGLIIAEIECPNVDYEFDRPSWLGEEVTHKKEYYNSELPKSKCDIFISRNIKVVRNDNDVEL